jgi:hypothetical protein
MNLNQDRFSFVIIIDNVRRFAVNGQEMNREQQSFFIQGYLTALSDQRWEYDDFDLSKRDHSLPTIIF